MLRRVVGTLLLAVSALGVVAEFALLHEFCGESWTLAISEDEEWVRAAEVWVFANALVGACGFRLIWVRTGWFAWLVSVGVGVGVGVLTFAAAIASIAWGDFCRIDV